MVSPTRPYPASPLPSQTKRSIRAASQCRRDRITTWARKLSTSFLMGATRGSPSCQPLLPAAAPGVQWGITADTPLWSVLSCHFSAEIPGLAMEKGDSWKNADGAEEQHGTEQPARLGSQQHHSPPRDAGAGSCCLSYYLSQLLPPLADPFKTPLHSISPSALSIAAAESLLLSLSPVSLQTPLISLVLTSPHWVAPIGLQTTSASLLCLVQVLLASPLASLLPCVLI